MEYEKLPGFTCFLVCELLSKMYITWKFYDPVLFMYSYSLLETEKTNWNFNNHDWRFHWNRVGKTSGRKGKFQSYLRNFLYHIVFGHYLQRTIYNVASAEAKVFSASNTKNSLHFKLKLQCSPISHWHLAYISKH